jgi:hypothetical protein
VRFEGEIFDDGAGEGSLAEARDEVFLKAGHDVPHPMFGIAKERVMRKKGEQGAFSEENKDWRFVSFFDSRLFPRGEFKGVGSVVTLTPSHRLHPSIQINID